MVDSIGEAPKILQSKEINASSADKKKKIELILLAVLIPVFLFLVYSTFFSGPKKPAAPPQASESAATVTRANGSQATSAAPAAVRSRPVAEEESWGHSPFSLRRQDDENVSKGPMQLNGIVFDEKGVAYAIVNQKIVKVGDRIADNTVRSITDGEVIFQSDEGVKITLKS